MARKAWEPRPLPTVTPETEPFWEAASDDEFLVCTCNDCGLTYYYPRALCPDCFSDDIDWHPVEGTGTVYSYSVAERAAGWPEEALPLVVAYVELSEGPRVLTNLVDCDPEAVEVGAAVEVRFVPSETEQLAVPVFELI